MTSAVEAYVSRCKRCICRKALPQRAPIVPIVTSQPLELVCVDYLLVEPSYGYEHLLVIVDHFTKFARVVPTKNESARTTAKALLENFISCTLVEIVSFVINEAKTTATAFRIFVEFFIFQL